MLNAYNGVTIDAQSWRAIIQPKVRIEMAIVLDHNLTESRCPSCSVRLKWVQGKRFVKWCLGPALFLLHTLRSKQSIL